MLFTFNEIQKLGVQICSPRKWLYGNQQIHDFDAQDFIVDFQLDSKNTSVIIRTVWWVAMFRLFMMMKLVGSRIR